MRRRAGVKGFTIIELLIILGIIALLISILLPTVGKARESARRANCAKNLAQIGLAARAFATERGGGDYPMSFATPEPNPKQMVRMPMAVSLDAGLMADPARWKLFGIPMTAWERYGASESVWKCPSSDIEFRRYNVQGGFTAPNWGPLVWTDYQYLGGLVPTTANKGKSVPRWGIAIPAVSLNDKRPEEKLLAADGVFLAGSSAWGKPLHINHASSKDPYRVDFQAVVYGDGHVGSVGREMYPKRVSDDKNNYSLLHDGKSGFFFWGAAVSYTAGYPIPPPAPPKPPTTPTPPTTPKPPAPPPPPPPPPPPNTTDPLP